MNTSILRISDFQNAIAKIITPESAGGGFLPPDSGFVPDRHPIFEILVNLIGNCDYPLAGKLFHLTPGSAVIIPPWTPHSYGYRSCDTGLLHLWFRLHPVYHGSGCSVLHGNRTSHPEFAFSISSELHTLFLLRWEAWKQKGKPGQEELFFRNVLNSFLDEMMLDEKKLPRERRNVVAETITLIHNANGRGCTLDFLAKQVNCSKYHLAHAVKTATGQSIGDIIDEARTSYVASAQKQGLPQKEIAVNLGFASAASFWNWYHRKKRQLPPPPAKK